MHIAYTALTDDKAQPIHGRVTDDYQLVIRRKAYYNTCNKFSKEITAIQKYLPGWIPPCPAR